MTHELKIWPSYFEDILAGKKTFELRENDRGFLPGDELLLKEYDPQASEYTERSVRVQVTSISYGEGPAGRFGLKRGHACMSIRRLPEAPDPKNLSAEEDAAFQMGYTNGYRVASSRQHRFEALERRIAELREIAGIQLADGNWNQDPYMLGMANAFILALAILNGTEPAFKTPPDSWLREHREKTLEKAVAHYLLAARAELLSIEPTEVIAEAYHLLYKLDEAVFGKDPFTPWAEAEALAAKEADEQSTARSGQPVENIEP